MKIIEARIGCLSPVECGKGKAHICGSLDACSVVRGDGFVCTFGCLSSTPLHEASDIDQEVTAEVTKYETTYGKATPEATASIQLKVLEGKNVWTQEMENESIKSTQKVVSDNKAMHDLNPAIFGHG